MFYIKKNTCTLLISVITFIITVLTHPLQLKPTHTTKPIHILPKSHLNSSKSVLQIYMNTISTLYFFYDVSTLPLRPRNMEWDHLNNKC